MLEKPAIADDTLRTLIREAYGLSICDVAFLPFGADVHSAVYRLNPPDGEQAYFLKLRAGPLDETPLLVTQFLAQHGLAPIIAALPTRDGRLYCRLGGFTCVLYPYVSGENGFHRSLSARQWHQFGAALRTIHNLPIPPELQAHLPREDYRPDWRAMVQAYQTQVAVQRYDEPVAAQMAAAMRAQQATIRQLVARAAHLAGSLCQQSLPLALCHADLHAGNVLLTPQGAWFIVDWDQPILAPKERDLMFIGAGIGGTWNTPAEDALFYDGYGEVKVNQMAIHYYRFERIVQDIAAYCQEILDAATGGADLPQGFAHFGSIFAPDGPLVLAERAYGKATPDFLA